MRLSVLLLLASGCDTALNATPRSGDAGVADASASCLEANEHSDYAYIQNEIFGVGATGMYKACSFGSCHDTTPAAEADLNLTPCLDGQAAEGSPTCNPSSGSYDAERCCEASEYDAMRSWERLVSVRSGQHPDFVTANGAGDSIVVADVSGTKEATLTDADAEFDASWVDRTIVVEGSDFAGNRGPFRVVEVPSPTQIRWRSSAARAEPAFDGTWKVVVSGAGDDLTFDGATMQTTLVDSTADFTGMDYVNQAITIKGATTTGNNGTFDVVAVPDANTIVFANAAGATEAFTGTWRLGRNVLLVAPSDPMASYLLVKLVDTPENELLRYGTLMPQTSSDNATLCEEKVGAIRRWIEAGAPVP